MLVGTDSPVTELELTVEDGPPKPGADAVSRPTFERRFRMSPNLKGWLLLDQGPAVETLLGGARKIALASCKPAVLTVAAAAWGLPPGRTAIAFSPSPPDSWKVDLHGSPVPEDKARAAADEGLAKLGGENPQSWLVPTADGWFVRCVVRRPVHHGGGPGGDRGRRPRGVPRRQQGARGRAGGGAGRERRRQAGRAVRGPRALSAHAGHAGGARCSLGPRRGAARGESLPGERAVVGPAGAVLALVHGRPARAGDRPLEPRPVRGERLVSRSRAPA